MYQTPYPSVEVILISYCGPILELQKHAREGIYVRAYAETFAAYGYRCFKA